jgi:alkylhydroperoxidase family enzyme
MAYLRLIEVGEAAGIAAEEYEAAVERAGKVFNVVKSMSLSPGAMRASMRLYREVMYGESELTREQRELLAVVVSAANDCYY